MAKPRKTLGGIDWPVCEALMRQIETQSTVTLSRWAVDHAAREYLPLCGEAPALTAAVEGCRKHLTGQLSLKELKPLLREASAAARDTEGAVEQAAARATATACAVIQTPTNALGYLFYGAAAAAYSKAGTEDASRWDNLARAELEQALEELRAVSVPDEPNPAKINWNC